MSDTPSAAPAGPEAGSGLGPLGDLALSFSGGGYRAAAFHLGALRLFERVGLLRDVVALSTVSGGSIVGAAWVLSVMRGEAFAAFDARFSAYLAHTNVIRDALAHLESHRQHGHPDWPSLIRSAARIYAHPELFGDARLGEIAVPREAAEGPRFREVILNSTEFRTGVDFRFRRSANPHARVGNGNLRVPRAVAEQVRVADAVAASSCFPGGFEPFLFPDQFDWPAELPLDRVRSALGPAFKGGVPLMDGGIWDNQGVDSLVLAFERGGAATLFISDVAGRNEDIYNFPQPGRRGWLTLRMASWLGWLLLVASAISAVLVGRSGWDDWRAGGHGGWFVFRYALPFAFCAGMALALVWMRLVLREVQNRLRQTVQVRDVWHDLARLTVQEALMLVQLRVTSLLALTSTVFMKRIRGLIFSSVTHDPRYRRRWMANFIYAMDIDRPKLYRDYPWMEPSAALRTLARDAEAYPTTLWFDTAQQMEMVIRVGEATSCWILLRFVLEHHAGGVEDASSALGRLFAALRQQWSGFNGAAASPAEAAA